MGKRSIVRLLAAVPLTASIAVNTPVSQNKNDIQFEEKNNKIEYYTIDKQLKPDPSLDLAIKIAKNKSSKKSKIVFADIDGDSTKKVNVINNTSEEKDAKNTVTTEQIETISKMVSGYPIEEMIPYIANRKPETAAFLIAIAKKESNWGKISPKSKNGDCFNYWGFKDHRFPFAAGHSCFPSREAAIETVGNRIDKLVANGRNTPAKFSVWKCGSACSKDGNVGKWISDVNAYYKPIMSAL